MMATVERSLSTCAPSVVAAVYINHQIYSTLPESNLRRQSYFDPASIRVPRPVSSVLLSRQKKTLFISHRVRPWPTRASLYFYKPCLLSQPQYPRRMETHLFAPVSDGFRAGESSLAMAVTSLKFTTVA